MNKQRLIEIIKEEIEEIIISEEYQDDNIINFDDINLQQEFNKINAEIFNNNVPVVPLKWSKRKTALGHVRSRVNRATREIISVELWISTFFAVTHQQFKNVMAHEMIHVLLNDEDMLNMYDPHGFEFMKQANRINEMGLGYNITKTNGEDLAVSDKTLERTANKPRIVIIFDLDGKFFIATTTRAVYERDFESLARLFENVIKRGKYSRVELNVVESTNPQLLKFPQQRSFVRSVSYGPVSDELLGELLDDNIIKTVTLEKGRERMVAEIIQ